MSVHAGDYAVDGQKVTAADVARKAAAEAEHLDRTAAAVWAVAAAATDCEECRQFLDMLGLDTVAVAHARHGRNRPTRSGHRTIPNGSLRRHPNPATATPGRETDRRRPRKSEHR